MLSTTNTEQLFGLACSGNIETLEEYWNGEGDLNITYSKFGKEHSLIMGAFRNQQYDTVRFLQKHGCRLTEEEQDEINMEYYRQKAVEFLASDMFKNENRIDTVSVAEDGSEFTDNKTESDMIDGVTTCCGYDFGTDMRKVKFCPICGKKLVKIQ